MSRKKVLIIDDSVLMRNLLEAILSEAPDLEIVGTAHDPRVAREMILRFNPDVITLDIEMPRVNGLSFLSRIMAMQPTPVVVISASAHKDADMTRQALELGAVDFVRKPADSIIQSLTAIGEEIIEKVRSAARGKARAQTAHTHYKTATSVADDDSIELSKEQQS